MSLRDSLSDITQLKVSIGDRVVGTLASTRDGLAAFQYDPTWLAEGFSISPFSLPLTDRVFVAEYYPLDGLFGVFDDSLPRSKQRGRLCGRKRKISSRALNIQKS